MKINDFYPKISEKKIPLNLLEIPSRNYLNWRKENLLKEVKIKEPNSKEKRKWVLLNIYDALYLLIVKELKSFNVDFKTIREVKNFLYNTTAQIDESILKEEIANGNFKELLKDYPNDQIEEFFNLLNKVDLFSLMDAHISEESKDALSALGSILFNVLVYKTPVTILISYNSDELEVFVYHKTPETPNKIQLKKDAIYNDFLLNKTFISIPMIPLVEKLFEKEEFDRFNCHYGFYNEQEIKVLEALNDKNLKEIKIIKHGSGDIVVYTKSEEQIKNEKASEIRKLLGLKAYENIELTFRNDKHIVVSNTKKNIIYNTKSPK